MGYIFCFFAGMAAIIILFGIFNNKIYSEDDLEEMLNFRIITKQRDGDR